jgi:glycosyltransferase involved in cell wall biosynthesis
MRRILTNAPDKCDAHDFIGNDGERNMTRTRDWRIGVVTFPITEEAAYTPISNLIQMLHSISEEIYLVTGNKGLLFFKSERGVKSYGIDHQLGRQGIQRILGFIWTQLRLTYLVARLSRNVDVWVFFMGGDVLFLPMFAARVLRRKVIFDLPSSSLHIHQFRTNRSIAQLIKADSRFLSTVRNGFDTKVIELLFRLNCITANRIVVYAKSIINEWTLDSYSQRILIANHHFLNLEHFEIKNRYPTRRKVVGYVGRLNYEKGIQLFIESIPEVLRLAPELEFLVVGDGPARGWVEEEIRKTGLESIVKLAGWAPHSELPFFLNQMRLVVLPSLTEGLPNVILEAMACGTPVLATAVGAVSEIIVDGKTGFIIKNKTPKSIAASIVEALKNPEIVAIALNARKLVENEFTFEKAVERYRLVLESLGGTVSS